MVKKNTLYPSLLLAFAMGLFSCNVINKASVHGFNSGYYKMQTENKQESMVYAEMGEEKLEVYPLQNMETEKMPAFTVPLKPSDSLFHSPMFFRKQGLDIDLTTILLKYRSAVHGLPQQLSADLNIAIYAGWRHDKFRITRKKNPLGKYYPAIGNFGYDIGIFAGPGVTPISPFSTLNRSTFEYSGMLLKGGIAAFLESDIASFGFALGYDHLLSSDRSVWIYHKKPWLGFVVGIALN